MKKLLAAILLILSSNVIAIEVGTCIREPGSDTAVCNLGCRAFNFTNFSNQWPYGVTTFGELGLVLAASQRALTPEEQNLCDGTPLPQPKSWRVADNPSSTKVPKTRPYYELLNPITHLRSSKKVGDVVVGSLCTQGDVTYHKIVYTNTAWRYLEGQIKYVVVCEFK